MQLELREPSDEAFEAVSSFAGKTGDLRSLSRVDLRVESAGFGAH